jgi:hypothetical protein
MGELSTKGRLEVLEQEIREAAYEAFFYVGQRLLEIRRDRLYEKAGFKSWSKYCGAGRVEYGKRHADKLIRASELRSKIGPREAQFSWRQMEELAKCETDNDAKRVAKTVISLAKKTGEKVTAKLIAQTRDGETSKPARELAAAGLEVHLDKLASIFIQWRTSLEKVDLTQWDSVPKNVLKRVITEGDALLSFLRS